jgi:outer membrane protein assembly factor BamD (BamD/ComL family)
MVPQVKLRQAFSSLAQFRGIRFDPTTALDARSELSDILMAYPDLAKEENVTSVIQKIDETLAAKLLQRADFYRRTHEPKAAVYAYRYLLVVFPKTPQAMSAREALAHFSKADLDQPEPRVDSRFLPPEIRGNQ